MTALQRLVTWLDPLAYIYPIFAALSQTSIIFPSLCPPVSVTPTVIWLALPLVEAEIPFQLEYSCPFLLPSNSLAQSSEYGYFYNHC